MNTTPAEAIKKLQEWYKTDMNQPISILVDDLDGLFEQLDNDSRYQGLYKSKDDIPKEIIDKCFGGMSEDDRVWEAIRESYAFDIDQYYDQQAEAQKLIEADQPLWDN